MSESAYSTLKPAWHLDRVLALRRRERIVPVELQLVLSDLCNQDCGWCAYRASDGLSAALFADHKGSRNPNRMIPGHKAAEIIDDAAELGIRSIIFTGGGEPTMHPDHLTLFHRAHKLGIDIALNTNGARLVDGWQDVLPRMTYIRLSIDAGSDLDYSITRRVKSGTYARVLDNLQALVQTCPDTVVGAGFVVSPNNYRNLVPGVRAIRERGARYVRIAFMQSTKGQDAYPGDTLEKARAEVEIAKGLASDSFAVVDLFETAQGKPYHRRECWYQEMVYYVGGNLDLYRCCYTAFTELGRVTSLKEQRLRDWWRSDAAELAHRGFDARACGTCPLAHKNDVLDYLVAGEPLHANFV